MKTPKLVSLINQEAMQEVEKDTVFFKDIRFWLIVIISILLLYLLTSGYPSLW
jgi:hypothetical protein